MCLTFSFCTKVGPARNMLASLSGKMCISISEVFLQWKRSGKECWDLVSIDKQEFSFWKFWLVLSYAG